ncbi:MAG: ABC transporter ATP-binding protein [Bacteroidia bacterium]|nr:ABC transporter ATP-binding protein [Bacteroidia bacterium]
MAIFSRIFRETARDQRYGGELSLRDSFRALRHVPPFLRMVWQTHPAMALGNLLLRAVSAVLPLLLLYVGKLIIDEVIRLSGAPGADRSSLTTLIAVELGLGLLTALTGRAISLLDALLGDLFSNRTSVRMIEHAALLDLPQFEDAAFYDKLERARQQSVSRVVLLSQVFSQIQDLVTLLALGAGLAVFNPWLILLLVVAVIPAFLSELHFNQHSYSLSRSWTPERRELDYIRYLGASHQNAKEIKIWGLAGFLRDRFDALSHRYYLENRRLAIRRSGWGFLFSSAGEAGYYVAYAVIAFRTVEGALSIGDLTFLAGSFARMRGLLQGFLSRFSAIAQSSLYLQDLFDFFDVQPEIRTPEQPLPFPNPIREGFVFEQVSFKYPKRDSYAVRNLSFHLRPGEKLALVGENGAGKTTLVKLLARLYDPSEGRILLDGHDLRHYSLDELRASIGVIFQDYVRYELTAGENIAIGNIGQREDQAAIESAAVQSLAQSVIDTLPKGYGQMLGRRFDGGVELSGGQWQKIALGRAYMREAQVMILDEPTSALDARAEYEVFRRFAELTGGRSSIIISHRFSTVRMADRILVLRNGSLEEIGSHEELLEHNGLYAELFRLQAQGYR